MKVILLHDVPGLGKPGDVKEVANGYARNYLLPRQLVAPATKAELDILHERVAAAQRRAAKERGEQEALAERIAAVNLTFAVRVGQGERLYGSVTTQNIADALQEQEHLVIDRRAIQLRDPLRQLGDFEVPVRVAQGIEPTVKVHIISSEAAQEAAPASGVQLTASEQTEEPAETAE